MPGEPTVASWASLTIHPFILVQKNISWIHWNRYTTKCRTILLVCCYIKTVLKMNRLLTRRFFPPNPLFTTLWPFFQGTARGLGLRKQWCKHWTRPTVAGSGPANSSTKTWKAMKMSAANSWTKTYPEITYKILRMYCTKYVFLQLTLTQMNNKKQLQVSLHVATGCCGPWQRCRHWQRWHPLPDSTPALPAEKKKHPETKLRSSIWIRVLDTFFWNP